MSTLLSIFSESSSTSSRNSVHDEELTMNAYEQKQQRQAEPSKASPSSPSQQTSPGGAPTRQPQDNNHNPKPHTPMDIHSSSYTHSHWSELSKSSVSFVQFRLQDQSFPAFCIVAILLAISFSTVLDLVTNTYPLQPYWSHLYIVLVSITIILGSLVFGVQLYVLMNTRDWSTLLSTSSQSTTAAGCCWQKVAAFLTFSIAPSTKKFPEVEAHTAPLHSCLQWLEPMYYLSTNITLAFYSIYLANLVYENPDLTYNPLPKPHHLQHENLTACLIIPTLLLLVMKRVNFRVACMAWTMNVLIHAALILSFHLYDSISLFLLLIPFTFFLLSEYHRQLWSSFQFYQHIQALIEEINQSAEIKKQNEMRHLMGNVAHDLKTVSIPLTKLSLFLSCLLCFSLLTPSCLFIYYHSRCHHL